ncbi:MAG: single-stranded-DNA-specific exonuclease RecJ [Candidatus Omnitrophota bacterium]|nr:single-stranded-DNA-specific exonuclease RecJ [Candidatus Omnitrophota bacterium]MDZ4241324.1 single-stranded-DNA-specific exonuclease RecJ [Candidatus Omnitrophota bacterium]
MSLSFSQKIWNIRNPDPQLQVALSNALGVHPIVAQLCVNRGLGSEAAARDFLDAGLGKLHDPFLLKDMDKAVERIREARQNGERVLIFGDYDVDGVTSSALLYKTLKKFDVEVMNYIPHRIQEGYGLNESVGELALENSVRLIITVDCGITACREVEALNRMGLDVIIIDHHEPHPGALPPAKAVIDPKRADCPYPFKHLSAVGLAAKFSQALLGVLDQEALDLVTLGTIADVVPLVGENRIFVKAGLPRLGRTTNKGLAALIDVAKLKGKEFKPYFVGFILGPRINATGRMGSARKSLDLLLTEHAGEAYALAQVLEQHNADRQRLQKDVAQQAVDLVQRDVNFNEDRVIVLSQEGWHRGVLGIVASRLTEMYYRPSIVISVENGIGTASARSIAGFHLHDALRHCEGILENFGGHKLAAGLTIRSENIGEFRRRINDLARETMSGEALVPALQIDSEIALSNLDLALVETVNALEPYGEGNPEPVFCSRQLTVKATPTVMAKDTLKTWLTDGRMTFSAVGFGMGKFRPLLSAGQKVDVAYQLGIDDWNKSPMVLLRLKDIRQSQ